MSLLVTILLICLVITIHQHTKEYKIFHTNPPPKTKRPFNDDMKE